MSMILDGSNGVTFNDASLQGAAASPYVLKNRIINGAMVIDQRNAGAVVTPTNGQYTLDRWAAQLSQASKFTVQQSSTAPVGFINSLKVTSSSAYTVGSSEVFLINQYIEGLNVTDLAWGTANAKTVTLSFQVYSSLTGTFGGSIADSSQAYSYPFTYSIPTANTWTTISITIAGPTAGTWLTTNGIGIRIWFGLGVGATLSGTAGAWTATGYYSATGAVSVVGTSGATFYITGVQLEVGSTATPFERRLYGQELLNCMRYFQISSSFTGSGNTTVQIAGVIPFQVPMRATVALAVQGAIQVSDGTADFLQSSGAITLLSSDSNSAIFIMPNFTGITANRPILGYRLSANTNKITISAEL